MKLMNSMSSMPHIIRELILVKEDRLQKTFSDGVDGLSYAAYDLIINFLCTI